MEDVCMESQDSFQSKLVCVEYPGVVKDTQKMIETLGGLKNISLVNAEHNRRLELRFRPNDVYSKPACGDRHTASALLLKVKVSRRRKHAEPDSNVSQKLTPIVVGKVETIFRFKSLCDFQYLPMSNTEGTMVNIYPTLVPENLPTRDWLYGPAEYFLPPATFSRMDTMQIYHYRREAVEVESGPSNIIGRTRQRRSGHAVFLTYDNPSVPTKPRELALKFLQVKFLAGEHYQKVKKLFDDRPVWSKLALMCVTKYSSDQLKYLLPSLAYYFVTGPYRVMWVRFGYDPRANPAALIYQTLDYRIRTTGRLANLVKAKRSTSNYLLPYKLTPASRPKTALIGNVTKMPSGVATYSEDAYIFRPGNIPPSRQMFYQYCDVQVPEIDSMLGRLPRTVNNKCSERFGWLPSGFADQCREIINNYVMQQLKLELPPSTDESNKDQSGRFQELPDDSDASGGGESDGAGDEDDDECLDWGEEELSKDS